MPLIPIVDEAKIKKLTDEPKFGTVVDNNDPDQLGKIKVVIPGIFEGTVENLPWIRRKNDTTFCGDDAEFFDVPAIGSVVEVKWNYDENTPMYSGAPNSKKHTSNVFTNNYPYEGGIRFGKCVIKMDKASNIMTITNGSCFIQMDPLGNITLTCKGNMNLTSGRDLTITAPKTTINGSLDVQGSFNCAKGADGAITPINIATVAGGLVTGIQ
jgi:hypothetical protein